MVSLLCALSILGCSDVAMGAAPARDREGKIHFARGADSSFDRFSYAPSPSSQAWMRSKYWRMRTYPPYFDSRTAWFNGAWAYKDAMAIYPGESRPADHYLRDAQGRPLYIWYACNSGTCTQYAGDIGSASYRNAWLADIKASYAKGYKGVFVDDVNMELRISDGHGNLQWPIDPRTGVQMTERSWRKYMAEFMEQIRRELPGAEIVHNSLWFNGDDDEFIQRQHDAADLIEIERGINDSGLRGGEGGVSVRTMFKLIDRLHAKGKGVVLDANATTHAERIYGLAGYFLVSGGRDAMGNYDKGTPEDWWAGYDTDLGDALGPRYDLPSGVIRRDFTGGSVLLNVPDSPTRTVDVGPGFKDVDGTARTSVTLAAGQGAVLLRTAPGPVTPTETTIDPPTAPGTPPPAPTTDTPTSSAPGTTPPRKRGSSSPTASISRRGAATTKVARVNGKRVKISGRVTGATGGKVQIVVQRKSPGGKWKTARKLRLAVGADGAFSRTITATVGRHRVQARFLGAAGLKASSSPYRTFSRAR
jgi:hypothetical protein